MAKAGRLLAVSRGEYSSHEVIGFFVVLQDFVPDDELEQYLQQHPDDCRAYEFADDRFLAWMLQKGLMLEIRHDEMFLTGYGQASEFRFTPHEVAQCSEP